MRIHTVKITNFKSCYGTQEFDFDELEGLVKLSGPIGSGKTLLCEAIQWGLLGTVKGQTNPSLISWNTDACEVEITLTSKNKEVYIRRNIREPLAVEVDGKWGLIDKTGAWVFEPKCENVISFSEGLACVEIDGKYNHQYVTDRMLQDSEEEKNYASKNTLKRYFLWDLGFINVEIEEENE